MGNIQRGDNRQYLPNGVAEQSMLGDNVNAVVNLANTAATINRQAETAKMAKYQVELSNEFQVKNNEINTKYQADPTSPEREQELKQAFEEMSNKYQVGSIVQGEWGQAKQQIYGNFEKYNTNWKIEQQKTNATQDLKTGYETMLNQVSMTGLNGSSLDEMRLTYSNGINGLRTGATATLGEVVVNSFLKDADHDIMTTYISALAMNNPLQAQELLKREDVRNDIGNADTLEKLDEYVANSLSNQAKKTAVNELGNCLRSMNSADANTILDGKADLNKVMKFIENNKKLPEGSKDLILSIYGIGSKGEYYYDKDKKKIVKDPEGGSSRSSRSSRSSSSRVSLAKMTPLQKQLCAETLEMNLHDLINFSQENIGSPELSIKNIKNQKVQKQMSDFSVGYMQRVASMQGAIDSAYRAGVINKTQRDNYVNSYIAPVTDFLGSNLKQLDEGSMRGFGKKLGYDRIAKQFNTDGLKGKELASMQRQKLFAQNYYLDELNKVVAKTPHLKSIYDIESLSSPQQQEIYKIASENALKRAKRWTDKPEYFFAKEYPTIYAQPFAFFNKQDSLAITRLVAEETYKRSFEDVNGKSTLDIEDFAKNKMITEINNQAKRNRIKAHDTLVLRDTEMYISRPEPKNIKEFYQRIRELGITPEEFIKQAKERGFNLMYKPNGLSNALENAHKELTGKKNSIAGYYHALQELEYAKALKDVKNKK